MTIWEKVIVNLEKGTRKVSAGAALFSERVRAEIAIARLRIKLDDLNSIIREQYLIIGRKLVELNKNDILPDSCELLFKQEDIGAALAEIEARERDRNDIEVEIADQQAAFIVSGKDKEDQTAP